MQSEKIRALLKSLVEGKESLKNLKENPDEVAKKFNLNEEERKALKSAGVLYCFGPGPVTVYTFDDDTIEIGNW